MSPTKFRSKKNNDTATIPPASPAQLPESSSVDPLRHRQGWNRHLPRNRISPPQFQTKKKHGTHNPPHSDLDPPWKSSRKKNKVAGSEERMIRGFRIPMGKVESAWTCWAQLRWPILIKSIFRLHPETSVALWKQSNMKYVYIHIYRFHRFQVFIHTSTYHVGE